MCPRTLRKPASGMALKMSRVAFHLRAVICVVRSARKPLMKYLPPVV
jgi:hypothetical protein